jgi:site-specific recombinase XerC
VSVFDQCIDDRLCVLASDFDEKNLRAVQLLLGHAKLESTVRYLGIEVPDALEIAEQTEV